MPEKLRVSLIGISLKASPMFGTDIFTHPALFILRECILKDAPLHRICSVSIAEVFCNDSNASILGKIIANRSHVAGFSVYIWNINKVLELCAQLKKMAPRIKIVLGGPAASSIARKLLSQNKAIDIVVRGEGEATFVELLRHYCRGGGGEPGDVRGISYRSGRLIYENEDRPPIVNLDDIPSPWPAIAKHIKRKKRPSVIVYQTSRGCPFRCRYCYWNARSSTRFFSIGRIKHDLDIILAIKPTFVYWVDSNMFLQRERAKVILRHIIKRNRSAHIYYEMNMEVIDSETAGMIKQLKNAVFNSGLQDISDRALKLMGRGHFDRDRFSANMNMVLRKAPDCHISFDIIYGLPGTTLASYRKTIDFALSFRPGLVNFYPFLVMPGTEFFMNHKKYSLDFLRRPPYKVIRTDRLSPADIRLQRRIALCVQIAIRYKLSPILYKVGERFYKGRTAIYHLQPILDFFDYLERHMDLIPGRDYPDGYPAEQSGRDLLQYTCIRIGRKLNFIRSHFKVFLLDTCKDLTYVKSLLRMR